MAICEVRRIDLRTFAAWSPLSDVGIVKSPARETAVRSTSHGGRRLFGNWRSRVIMAGSILRSWPSFWLRSSSSDCLGQTPVPEQEARLLKRRMLTQFTNVNAAVG